MVIVYPRLVGSPGAKSLLWRYSCFLRSASSSTGEICPQFQSFKACNFKKIPGLIHLNFNFSALHFDSAANSKRVKLFWSVFTGAFIYEIIPAYIFPLLNSVSVFCLASQKASPRIQDIFTNIFGGAEGNEGLGLLSVSFDWQYITSSCVNLLNSRSHCSFHREQIYELPAAPARFVYHITYIHTMETELISDFQS